MGGGETTGPADEYEALRGRLLVRMRRQPADTRTLMRMFEGLSRAEAAQGRLSPNRRRELSANFEAVLNSLGSQILPAE